MPPKSQAQRRFGYAAAEGKVPGVSPAIGREFEGKGIKGLPNTVSQKSTLSDRLKKINRSK